MRSGYQPDSMSVGSVHEQVPTRSLELLLEAIGFLSVESGIELFGLRASLREHHHQDPEKYRKTNEAGDLCATARHERERAEERRHRVDQEDRLLMRQSHVEKPVVERPAMPVLEKAVMPVKDDKPPVIEKPKPDPLQPLSPTY